MELSGHVTGKWSVLLDCLFTYTISGRACVTQMQYFFLNVYKVYNLKLITVTSIST